MTTHDLTVNFIISAGFALIASMDVTFIFQIASYSTSIVVGGITIYKFFKHKK